MQMTIGNNDFRAPDGGGYLRVCNDETHGNYEQCFGKKKGGVNPAIRVTDRQSFERECRKIAKRMGE